MILGKFTELSDELGVANMADFDAALLRQEVNELTALLRYDKKWSDVRAALESKGLSPWRVMLVGFIEDSEENEFAVIVTDKQEVFEYQRKTSGRSSRILQWQAVANVNDLVATFPAVKIGLELSREM